MEIPKTGGATIDQAAMPLPDGFPRPGNLQVSFVGLNGPQVRVKYPKTLCQ
jgi:hypothetical protein